MRNARKFFVDGLVTLLSVGALLAPVAYADSKVSASVGVANQYLWRGMDLGLGKSKEIAVSGDVHVTNSNGAYVGTWASTGDADWGFEYDLYGGWGGKVGNFDVDASLWTYANPEDDYNNDGVSGKHDPGELVDGIVTVGRGPVKVGWYESLKGEADGDQYRYISTAYTKDKYSALYGQHLHSQGEDPGHLQLGYQVNDNLSFAVSKFVVNKEGVDSSPHFLINYSLPLTK